MNLKHLTNMTLLNDTKKLVKDETRLSLEVLHHLKEIERRRLFASLGYGSLFEYAVKELGYSEPSANRRIKAARIIEELPYVEEKIAEGHLNLTNLSLAGQLFKNEEIVDLELKKEILSRIENTSKKDCETELLKFAKQAPPPKEGAKQFNLGHFSLQVNVSQNTLKLFEEIKNVLAHHRLNNDELMRKIFEVALEEFKDRRFKTNAKFTTLAASPGINRSIPAFVKKQVYERDQGQCTNCKTRYKLEYDHIKPFSEGGSSTLKNLRLLCFSCNQRRLKT